MDQALLTIILLTYNRSKHLERNLAYLVFELQQLHNKNLVEIIISDNHSSDDTPRLMSSYKEQFENYNVIYNRNEENNGALNHYIQTARMASGKMVWWMGDDDFYCQGLVGRVLELCSKDYSHIFLNHSAFRYSLGDNLGFTSALRNLNLSDKFQITMQLLEKDLGPLMFISANIFCRQYVIEMMDSSVKKLLPLAFYNSVVCMSKGKSYAITDICIDNNWRDISWAEAATKMYLFELPYYIKKMKNLGYKQEQIDNVLRQSNFRNLKQRRREYRRLQVRNLFAKYSPRLFKLMKAFKRAIAR